jgi:hypothetical protein
MSRTEQRNRWRRLGPVAAALTMLASATIVLVLPATTASADTFGGCNSNEGCVPDNFSHVFCFSGAMNGDLQINILGALDYLHDETNYDASADGNGCVNTTDLVMIQDTSLGARGQYDCIIPNTAGDCERAELRFNPNELPSNADQTKTACHEIGHSVGLKHGIDGVDNDEYTDCMFSGDIPDGLNFAEYDAHHIQHINNRA